jgi:hypothetical protein
MKRLQLDREVPCFATLSLVGAALALGACSGDPPPPNTAPQAQAATAAASQGDEDGTSEPIDKLPFLGGPNTAQVLAELLAKPTALGETTALHMRLPPPQDPKLVDSLVRVVGQPDNLHVLFRSDALAQLGVIPKSPGKEYFTAFGTLSPDELETLRRNQEEIESGVFGEATNESVVFSGRSAIARTINPSIDPARFQIGLPPTPVNLCSSTPASTTQAWGQALFITDPAVVKDLARTWDPCTGAGTQGGVWTFAHLVREMANGSGSTPEDFVTAWLSQWLNSYVVNGDIVPARPEMFTQVIQPWAAASSATATLTPDPFTGQNTLTLSGPLDLNLAPFSLLAIVNRIDLGKTVAGGGGYNPMPGNSTASMPTTPGELRFIFGVVQPNPWGAGTEATCGRKPFTTIFEYGVPGTTCPEVVSWAQKWTTLQASPGFTPAYLGLLHTMTESVVKHGAAPTKGNQNALNQIRTNETALASLACGGPSTGPWELREFTLTNESPSLNTDLPASGLLRRHTVARTPDDATFSAGGADATINAFMATQVVPPSATTLDCSTIASYTVPYAYPVASSPFRGGNSFMLPFFWRATINPPTSHNMCARHQFSLNTCDGCHRGETATNGLGGNTSFTHVDPLSPPPVPLSKFLTGGGPTTTFSVSDPQYGSSTVWKYADLKRRLQRLFELSHCTSCIMAGIPNARLLDQLRALGPVPADIAPGDPRPFEVGPITNLAVVKTLLDLRSSVAVQPISEQVDFIRAADAFSH